MNNWYLGTIGYSYKDWVGPFYPSGTSQRGYLPYYSTIFNSVEINSTFHATPQQATVKGWAYSVPTDFRFCLKTPHRITHELGLRSAQSLMNEFIDALQPLGEKCGPILLQLPPKFTQEYYDLLGEFIEFLPRFHNYAIEFRHTSWYNEKTTLLLSQNNICWVTNDFPNVPKEINQTTSFIYIRWIGVNNLYNVHTHERVDKSEQLRWWLNLIHPMADQVKEIYGFFNNDYAGFAAGTCRRFKQIAGLSHEDDNIPYQERFL